MFHTETSATEDKGIVPAGGAESSLMCLHSKDVQEMYSPFRKRLPTDLFFLGTK